MGRPNNGILERDIFYDPLPSQQLFHSSPARFKGFSGPVGSGKSQALCQEAIRLSYQNPGRTGLLGAPTYAMLRDATQATLLEILNDNGLPYEHNKAENLLTMTDTRSRILFRSMDEAERLRGTNLAWFGLDELTYTQEEAWLRLEGRLRDPRAHVLCGFAAWTPKGYDWVYRKFIAESKVEGYQAIIAKPGENRHLLSRVPDYYERLRRSYGDKFYQQEVLGEYLSLDGSRVYYAFDQKTHVRDMKLQDRRELFWTLDFNVNPMSSLVAQRRQDGVIHILDEIFLRPGTTAQACEEFLRRYPTPFKSLKVFGDASGSAQQTLGGSDYDIIREHLQNAHVPFKFHVPKANPAVRDRTNLVNGCLKNAAGEVRLLIHSRCQELIADLEQVSYKADTSVIDKDKDRLRTHLSDALGYLLWQESKSAPIGERQERLV